MIYETALTIAFVVGDAERHFKFHDISKCVYARCNYMRVRGDAEQVIRAQMKDYDEG